MNTGRQANGDQWVGFQDCDEHISTENAECPYCELVALKRKIIHCAKCGASWYDDGWTPSCPSCRITDLQAQVERVDKIVSWMECLPQSTLYSRGIAYEFRSALEKEE